jgi:hypothetical protein
VGGQSDRAGLGGGKLVGEGAGHEVDPGFLEEEAS